jgi:hypothetical protein
MALPTRDGTRFTTAELVADVKAHALRYYENGKGWDYVIETMSDEDIAGYIGKATSKYGARNKVYKVVSLWAGVRDDAIAAGGEF